MARGYRIVEGLDPDMIAQKHEPAAAGIVQRHREHAIEPGCEFRSVLLPEMDQYLGVAGGAEAVSGALQFLPQLPVVVDLAVEDHARPCGLR